MDGLSALSVAAAVVQFLDFSLKALEICRQVRDSERSSTERNAELEQALRTIKDLRKELNSSTAPRKTSKRIRDAASKCIATTDELLKTLEHVRGAGKQISTAKAAFRVLRERKTIEKLENTLKERQRIVDQALLQDVW